MSEITLEQILESIKNTPAINPNATFNRNLNQNHNQSQKTLEKMPSEKFSEVRIKNPMTVSSSVKIIAPNKKLIAQPHEDTQSATVISSPKKIVINKPCVQQTENKIIINSPPCQLEQIPTPQKKIIILKKPSISPSQITQGTQGTQGTQNTVQIEEEKPKSPQKKIIILKKPTFQTTPEKKQEILIQPQKEEITIEIPKSPKIIIKPAVEEVKPKKIIIIKKEPSITYKDTDNNRGTFEEKKKFN